MNRQVKSLGKFTPHVDPTLRARLAGSSKTESIKAGTTVTTTALAGVQPQPGPPVTIKVELWLEIIDDPQKCCPAYAYLGRKDAPGTQRIVAVLNHALWPAAAALARGDGNALRWLVDLAIVDRCLTWPTHPILRALGRHLCQAALGERAQDYQAGLWAAHCLKDHPLFAIDPSILKRNAEQSPQKFAEFNVEVDSATLEGWRAKFGAKHKSLAKI